MREAALRALSNADEPEIAQRLYEFSTQQIARRFEMLRGALEATQKVECFYNGLASNLNALGAAIGRRTLSVPRLAHLNEALMKVNRAVFNRGYRGSTKGFAEAVAAASSATKVVLRAQHAAMSSVDLDGIVKETIDEVGEDLLDELDLSSKNMLFAVDRWGIAGVELFEREGTIHLDATARHPSCYGGE
jgi:hypothetical protein